ncbi:MAG TPA: hypothetical protein VLM05_11765 [Mycobacteriales bacterium]|nr:hypothetical protein [Mycobacteriales bacterium]
MPTTTTRPRPLDVTGFRTVRRLLGGYLAIGVLALAATIALRHHPAEVDPAVWTRGIIVVVTAALLLAFAVRAGHGSRPAFRRLRVISVVTTVAIAAIVALPGTFPLWMRLEQGACGLLMLAVAVLTNGRRLRSGFAAAARG